MLSNPANKANISNFLFTDGIEQLKQKLHPNTVIQLAGGFHKPALVVTLEAGNHMTVDELQSDHEEADS